MSSVDALRREAEKLRDWSNSVPLALQFGDWEVAYPGWAEVFCAWARMLSEGAFERVLKELSTDVLYLIRRDAAQRGLIRELVRTDGRALLTLTRLAVSLRDLDTQLLCAWELVRLDPLDDVAEELLKLSESNDECVLLAALVSLADAGSPLTEQRAIANWHRTSAPSEVHLASLYALARLDSLMLPGVLEQSELRGDNAVQEMATRVRESSLPQEYGSCFKDCLRSQATIECGFRAAVSSLRDWAHGIPPDDQAGEWECSYFGWEQVYQWWSMLIRYSNSEAWSSALADDALYALARDSENMVMLGKIGKQGPKHVLALSRRILEQSDPDLNYQCAVALGTWVSLDQGEELLLELAAAREPWVRQSALRALAKLGSKHTERLAEVHWEAVANDAFERQAILDVLWQFGSPQLGKFLERAEQSGHGDLIERASQIRSVYASTNR